MSLIFKNDGSSIAVAWSGIASGIIFRDRAGRMVGAWAPSPTTQEAAWLPAAVTAEVCGEVQKRTVPLASAETTVIVRAARAPLVTATRQAVEVQTVGERVLHTVGAVVFWAVTGAPAVGSPVASATVAARAWLQQGRATVERVWTSG
jgi:hypothetical protein